MPNRKSRIWAARHAVAAGAPATRRRRPTRLIIIAGLAVFALVGGLGAAYANSRNRPTSTTDLGVVSYPIPDGALFVSPNGDDNAAGTESAPLRTLAAAVRKVKSGGTIVMRGGIYREDVGGINKKVTIQPYPREAVEIKGSDIIPNWTKDGDDWRATGWASRLCQTCYHEDAIDPAYPLAGKPDQVFRNGEPLVQVATRGEVKPGTFFIDPSTKALYIGDDPSGAVIEASVRWRAMLLNPSAAGSVIRGLTFSEFAPHWNEDQLAMLVVNAPDAVIENNVFTRSAGRALGVFNTGITVLNNKVVDNGGTGGIFNRAHDVLVQGNIFSRNNQARFAISSCDAVCTIAGLKMAHTRNALVTNNVFSDNHGTGFWCDLGCTEGVITGNTVTNNANNGIYWEVSSGAVISDNDISGNGRGIKVSGSDRVTITNNRFGPNKIQIGVYDDARSPSTDTYSRELGLTWDTADVVITGNTFDASTGTSLLVETNRTNQADASDMIKQAADNRVAGTQTIQWCESSCKKYSTIAEFAAATGIPFGLTVKALPATSPSPSSNAAKPSPSPAVPTSKAPSSPTPKPSAASSTKPSTKPSSSSAPSPSSGKNLLSDPGFEADPPVWTAFAPGTELRVVSSARGGNHALQVRTTREGPVTAGATSAPRERTKKGQTYQASCWVRSSSSILVRLQVQEYTPNWTSVTRPSVSNPVRLGDNKWRQVTLTYTATTDGNLLPLTVQSHNLTAGGPSFVVDDCSLTSG